MNDYTRGVIETLSWMYQKTNAYNEDPQALKKVNKDVRDAMHIISHVLGNNFQAKIERMSTITVRSKQAI